MGALAQDHIQQDQGHLGIRRFLPQTPHAQVIVHHGMQGGQR